MNSLTLLDSFLSRSLSTSRSPTPPDSPSAAASSSSGPSATPSTSSTSSSSSSGRRRRRPHSTTPASRTPGSSTAGGDKDGSDEQAHGDEGEQPSPSEPRTAPSSSRREEGRNPPGHLPRRSSDYALQTTRNRQKRSDGLLRGLQMTAQDADGSSRDEPSQRRGKGKEKSKRSSSAENSSSESDKHSRASRNRDVGSSHLRQSLRRADSNPASMRSSGSWGSALWGLSSWLDAPLTGDQPGRRSRSSSKTWDYPPGDDIQERVRSSRSSKRRRRREAERSSSEERTAAEDSKSSSDEDQQRAVEDQLSPPAEAEGGDSSSDDDASESSSGSSSSSHEGNDSYQSHLDLPGRLLFANRIFTPFHHPSLTASVPNLPSELGMGAVGTTGLGGMEDVDTVDFEGGESETEDDPSAEGVDVVAAAAAMLADEGSRSSSAAEDTSQASTPGTATPRNDVKRTDAVRARVPRRSATSSALAASQHERDSRKTDDAKEVEDYFGPGPGEAESGAVDGKESTSSRAIDDKAADAALATSEKHQEAVDAAAAEDYREAREASAALQQALSDGQMSESTRSSLEISDKDSPPSYDEATGSSDSTPAEIVSEASGSGLIQPSANPGLQPSTPSTPSTTSTTSGVSSKIGGKTQPNALRRLLSAIKRAILAILLAPYRTVTYVIDLGSGKSSRRQHKVEGRAGASVAGSPSTPQRRSSSSSKTLGQRRGRTPKAVSTIKGKQTGDIGGEKHTQGASSLNGSDSEDGEEAVTEDQARERAERREARKVSASLTSTPTQATTAGRSVPAAASADAEPDTPGRRSRLLPNPHPVDPMLVHEPKAKKVTGEIPEEAKKRPRGASLAFQGGKAVAATPSSEVMSEKASEAKSSSPGNLAAPGPRHGASGDAALGSPAVTTPVPRPAVIHHTPKILVLDLDETLIHSTSRSPTWTALRAQHSAAASMRGSAADSVRDSISTGGSLLGLEGLGGLLGLTGTSKSRSVRPHMVEVVLEGRSVIYHVYKRPFVDYFLRKVAAWYHVVVFTASVQEYADPVIDWLDQGRGLIAGRLFRDACTYSNGSYLKDLHIVDGDLSRVCLVDNSPASYLLNPSNGIPIEGWTHDPFDEALLDLLPVLDSLRFAQDVRHVLGLRITADVLLPVNNASGSGNGNGNGKITAASSPSYPVDAAGAALKGGGSTTVVAVGG